MAAVVDLDAYRKRKRGLAATLFAATSAPQSVGWFRCSECGARTMNIFYVGGRVACEHCR